MEAAEAPLPDEIEDGFGAGDESGDVEPEQEPEPAPEPVPETAPAAEAPAEAAADAPQPTSAQDHDIEDRDEDDDEDAGPPPSVEGMTPPKRDLDQNLRAILQEEVAREMAARATDSGETVIETPATPAETETPAEDNPDLELIREPSKPLDDDSLPDIGPAPSPDRVDVFANAPDIAAAAKAPRKDLFPDIEEINSTLDSHGLEDEDEDEIDAEDRSGFGRAFFAVIAIAALLLALYLTAPSLAASVPALEPALTAYVEAINSVRSLFTGFL